MVVIYNLHFDVGGKGQIEMEGVENGSGPLDTVSRSTARIEKRPHSARLYERTGATEYYIFRSYGQGFPLERVGFFWQVPIYL